MKEMNVIAIVRGFEDHVKKSKKPSYEIPNKKTTKKNS